MSNKVRAFGEVGGVVMNPKIQVKKGPRGLRLVLVIHQDIEPQKQRPAAPYPTGDLTKP